MRILDKAQHYFHRLLLSKKLKAENTDREFVNLKHARTIGILYNATLPESNIIVTKFSELLKSRRKKVTLLGFVDDNKLLNTKNTPLFNRKDVNWMLQPKGEKVRNFMNYPFDILINAFIGTNTPLEYIASLSKARYRVGEYNQNNVHCFELMINLGDRMELQYLLDQIAHYLNLINTDYDNDATRSRHSTSHAVSG